MEADPNITRYLEAIRTMYESNSRPPEWKYTCIEDFVLKHGRAYGPRAKRVRKGPPKQCFMNAFKLVMDYPDKLTYVEGYAMSVIPIHHAWAVDSKGRVYDPTWDQDRHASATYFGVPVPMNYLFDTIQRSKTYGVFHDNDVMVNRELLSKEWTPQ